MSMRKLLAMSLRCAVRGISGSCPGNDLTSDRLNPELLLDLPAENALLAERLQPVLGSHPDSKSISQSIAGINESRLNALREIIAQALAAGETREQLIARVKDMYNRDPGRSAGVVALMETVVTEGKAPEDRRSP